MNPALPNLTFFCFALTFVCLFRMFFERNRFLQAVWAIPIVFVWSIYVCSQLLSACWALKGA